MRTLLLSIGLFISLAVLAQEKTYTIEGRITISERVGDVNIFLIDKEQFKIPFSGIDTLIFPVNYDKSYVEFQFENVLAGTYGLRAYQDTNGNGKIDKGLFRPREPWALSWKSEMVIPTSFEDISFEVKDNMRINLILGK